MYIYVHMSEVHLYYYYYIIILIYYYYCIFILIGVMFVEINTIDWVGDHFDVTVHSRIRFHVSP